MPASDPPSDAPRLLWTESGEPRSASWRSASGAPPPKRVVLADDATTADAAYRLACEGTALLWRGDYHNARQLLAAMQRRADRGPPKPAASPAEAFHLHRQAQSQRARTLNMLLVALDAGHRLPLRRAPDLVEAGLAAFGPAEGPYVMSLRELLGVIGAYEWQKRGVSVPALGDRIHPHYGVFAPIRSEYVALVAGAPLSPAASALDIGTGTGVLAAVLARRGVPRIVATDQDERALRCARENLDRLGLAAQVVIERADLFPDGRADLVVCNPPWVPARATSSLEHAIFDPDSRMLRGFLSGLVAHLNPGGEGWLILSDLAEHLGLRSREALLSWITDGGLRVIDRLDARPTHPKATDPRDPLHAARAAEITSLWRLGRDEPDSRSHPIAKVR